MEEPAQGTFQMAYARILSYVHVYRFSFILGLIGIIFFSIVLFLLLQQRVSQASVEFSHESTQSSLARIRVDVGGAVVQPAVYDFVGDARIEDAIRKAGGLTPDADTLWMDKSLNRAAKLIDGGKIYIPSVNEFTEGKTQNSKIKTQNSQGGNTLGVLEGLININTASVGELDTLPGVGEVTAGKIVNGRPYQSIEELKTKKAVGNALFEKIKNLITVF